MRSALDFIKRRLTALRMSWVRWPTSCAHGCHNEVWTTARIAELIEREFGVSYHRDDAGRLLHSIGWSH